MKPNSFIAAMIIGAGGFSATAMAAQSDSLTDTGSFFKVNPISKLEQRLKVLDRRGRSGARVSIRDVPVPSAEVPGLGLGQGPGQNVVDAIEPAPREIAPVQLAQSSDAAFRVNQLEEQMRVLNGKVEEMTFQLLQLQEQIRKMQEDNEFRFRELEDQSALKKKNRKTAKAGGNRLGKPKPSGAGNSTSGGKATRKSITELLNGEAGGGSSKLGAPPQKLGTLTFDANGNLVDSNVGKPIDLTGKLGNGVPAGLPNSPNEMFNLGYQYIQGGDYERAGEVFRHYVAEFPGSSRDAEARFWLGESLFAQGDYEASARVFLENHKAHPQGALAPQNLLKLGISLSGLRQRELACATFAEVPKKYPGMSNAVRKRVAVEQRAAKCKNG